MNLSKSAEWILSGILVIAIISVLVSRNSTTATALQSLGAALSNILGSIVAPISSGSASASNSAGQSGSLSISPTNNALSAITAATISAAPSTVTSPNTGTTATGH